MTAAECPPNKTSEPFWREPWTEPRIPDLKYLSNEADACYSTFDHACWMNIKGKVRLIPTPVKLLEEITVYEVTLIYRYPHDKQDRMHVILLHGVNQECAITGAKRWIEDELEMAAGKRLQYTYVRCEAPKFPMTIKSGRVMRVRK